jgi:hypothetical protein
VKRSSFPSVHRRAERQVQQNVDEDFLNPNHRKIYPKVLGMKVPSN